MLQLAAVVGRTAPGREGSSVMSFPVHVFFSLFELTILLSVPSLTLISARWSTDDLPLGANALIF